MVLLYSEQLMKMNTKPFFSTGLKPSHLFLLCLLSTLLLVFQGCSRTAISVRQSDQRDSLNECVVLIHGMGRTLHSMDSMQQHLLAAGYHTVNLGYPSTRACIEEIVAAHFPPALKRCQQFSPSRVHFVSHSLGGIVLRSYFKENELDNMGRVVMLSPPNQGSEAADSLKDWWLYRWINGPAGQQLTTAKDSIPNRLGPVPLQGVCLLGEKGLKR